MAVGCAVVRLLLLQPAGAVALAAAYTARRTTETSNSVFSTCGAALKTCGAALTALRDCWRGWSDTQQMRKSLTAYNAKRG